jgi:hypothetical protein
MEILFYLASICLTLVIILGFYDGFYLHLWKYELFNHKDSIYEHKTHTIRAILFPIIIWLLFINTDVTSFWAGILIVIIDLIVLGVDAYSEKDSRKFMDGLPQQEYLIHLIVNGFHFAAIFLLLSIKLEITNSNIIILENINQSNGSEILSFIAVQSIPGSIIFALAHLLLLNSKIKQHWTKVKSKIRA